MTNHDAEKSRLKESLSNMSGLRPWPESARFARSEHSVSIRDEGDALGGIETVPRGDVDWLFEKVAKSLASDKGADDVSAFTLRIEDQTFSNVELA